MTSSDDLLLRAWCEAEDNVRMACQTLHVVECECSELQDRLKKSQKNFRQMILVAAAGWTVAMILALVLALSRA